jgi:hypothetical protein
MAKVWKFFTTHISSLQRSWEWGCFWATLSTRATQGLFSFGFLASLPTGVSTHSIASSLAPNVAMRRWSLMKRRIVIARIPSKITLCRGFFFGCVAGVAQVRIYSHWNDSLGVLSGGLGKGHFDPRGERAVPRGGIEHDHMPQHQLIKKRRKAERWNFQACS